MKGPSHFRGLAHISIMTRDLDASIGFYQRHLDFALTYRTTVHAEGAPSGFFPVQYAIVELGSCALELLQPADVGMVKAGGDGAVGHFAIEVDDLDAVMAPLKEAGVLARDAGPAVYPTLFKGSRSVTIKGISGESIELFEYRR